MKFSLPLVSVVVVNYNYGRYLSAAIDSIYGQTYPHIECIVVDNASTDISCQVLEQIQAAHPTTIIVRRRDNGGQSIASLEGLRASRGQYVVFLDADDILLPEFIRTHVFVQLSSRVHVGLTSSDILQAVDGQVVVTTGEAMNGYILKSEGPEKGIARPITQSMNSDGCFDGFDETVLDRLYFVPPGPVRWVWSPTSGNVYRRDALDLVMSARRLPDLRAATDFFCCVGVNGLCGGLLIDRALSVYRIHGENLGTTHAQLHNIRVMRDGMDMTVEALEALLDHFGSQRASTLRRLHSGNLDAFLDSMAQWLNSVRPPPEPQRSILSKFVEARARLFAAPPARQTQLEIHNGTGGRGILLAARSVMRRGQGS
jgi:glycosyltransferase involved in cell wall biosynthesis